jgi:hypothetical protein
MLIARVENNAVLEVADYRSIFPNTSFPPSGISAEFMAENGCLSVTVWKQHDATQKLVSCDPYIEDGQVYTVQVQPKTQDEIDAELATIAQKARARRNQLLKDSDWTQLADATVDKAAWAVYRQALRDLPSQDGFPANIVWPNDPTVVISEP